ncbi:GTP cyclohydrolase II [Candidatus Micrarchaeota archaeon]|nr:GTP cyclohydrolase II [Candidatus Micrarchaeota archaeon]MBU2476661.1 GTP cyclohydrolase II [Candidatus Micrarchaeota archaeon]
MFCSVEEALNELKKGNFLIIFDHDDREAEGDLFIPAEKVSEKQMAFLIENTSGIICVPMEEQRLKDLGIPKMVEKNSDNFDTSFSVSVDAVKKVGSGISAKDRIQTIKTLIDSNASKKDFGMPGHVFPLYAKKEGVLKRKGHTESAVDLCRLSELYPAGVIGELVNKNGTVKTLEQLKEFSEEHKIKMIEVEDLVEFRKKNDFPELKNHFSAKKNFFEIKIESCTNLPTDFGVMKLYAFSCPESNCVHLALVKGKVKGKEVLTRVHSRCITGEIFHSLKCDCGPQLELALKKINEEGSGIIIYLFQEGRGIGIIEKIKAYKLQETGLDTVEANKALGHEADQRDFSVAAGILKKLGVTKVKLMTNNPEKIKQLEENGIKVTERIPLKVKSNPFSKNYFLVKKKKLGHLL